MRAAKFGGVRTGGRSARVVDEVLTAVVELLAQHGYVGLRIDEVAGRSGVNKTTIYRRWPTKSQLVSAALEQYKPEVPASDTGDLEHDLVDMFLKTVSKWDKETTRGLIRMFQYERNDPELDKILAAIRTRIIATRRVRIDLAVKRGELPRKTDVELLIAMLSSAVYARLHTHVEMPSRKVVTEIVTIIIAGAKVRWA